MRGNIGRPIVCWDLWLYFIARVVIFVARIAIEWDWNSLVKLSWHRLLAHFRWLDKLRLIGSSSLKFDRLVVLIGYAFGPEDVFLLRVLRVGLNNKRFILIFVGTLANKGHLI